MREINLSAGAMPGKVIPLYYQGEKNATCIRIDLSDYVARFGEGEAELLYRRPGDAAPYAVTLTRDGDVVSWTVSSLDVARPGRGQLQLVYTAGETVARTPVLSTYAVPSLGQETDPPEEERPWYDKALQAAADAEEAADRAEDAADRAEAAAEGGGGGTSDLLWRPTVSEDGELSWEQSSSDTPPEPVNIMGPQGTTGATPNLQIGTVTTLDAGSDATASITGTPENPLLNLGIPRGENGGTSFEVSPNIFDKSQAETGKLFYNSSSGPQIIDDDNSFICYVALSGAGTYRTVVNVALSGAEYAQRVPILKEDKTFLQNVIGTYVNGSDSEPQTDVRLDFTITDEMINNGAYCIAFCGSIYSIDNIMIVKDIDYPDTYYPYGEIEADEESNKLINPLFGKTAIFFGDSICAGTTVGDVPQYGYGWAGLIGAENKMSWHNSGQNGATFASGLSSNRTIITQITAGLAGYSDADFVVFEGGTNDADELGDSGLGDISSGWDSFDTSTFSGAFEQAIYAILTGYPNAKYLYVIPPKMGTYQVTETKPIRRVFFDRAIDICQKWGIQVCDLWNETPLNPNLTKYWLGENETGPYYTDGQHLTLLGYQSIYHKIAQAMRGL